MRTDENAREARVTARLPTWLASERLAIVLPSLAVALALPSLWGGWVADDHHHRLRLADPSDLPESLADVPGSPMELFTFADGDPVHMRPVMDLGLWPWWTLPELLAAFMRPVTALTHWVDYRLWPESPAFMHAQSLLWFAGLITVTTLLYRRLYGLTWVAGLAALLYAIDDARAIPVGWLANRNALITTFLGVSALIAHDRWRRNGWHVGAVVGPLLLTASLLAKEAGIATCAYLFAYALFLDRGTRRERFLALLPYAAVVLVWRIAWTHLGYGVWGIEIYVDPVVEPLRYAAAVLRRCRSAGRYGSPAVTNSHATCGCGISLRPRAGFGRKCIGNVLKSFVCGPTRLRGCSAYRCPRSVHLPRMTRTRG